MFLGNVALVSRRDPRIVPRVVGSEGETISSYKQIHKKIYIYITGSVRYFFSRMLLTCPSNHLLSAK